MTGHWINAGTRFKRQFYTLPLSLPAMTLIVFIVLSLSIPSCVNKNSSAVTTKIDTINFKLLRDTGNEKAALRKEKELDAIFHTVPNKSKYDYYYYYKLKCIVNQVKSRKEKQEIFWSALYADSMVSLIQEYQLNETTQKDCLDELLLVADFLHKNSRFEAASKIIAKTKILNKSLQIKCADAKIAIASAALFFEQAKYREAIEQDKIAISNADYCDTKKESNNIKTLSLKDIGYAYRLLNELDSSIIQLKFAEEFIKSMKKESHADSLQAAYALKSVYDDISEAYWLLTDYKTANHYRNLALRIAIDELKDENEIKYSYIGIGWCYYKEQNLDSALYMANLCLPITNNLNVHTIASWHSLRMNIYNKQGNFKEVVYHISQRMKYNDSIYLSAIETLKFNPEVEFQRLDKLYSLNLMDKKNQFERSKTTLALISGILLLFLAVGLVYFLVRSRKSGKMLAAAILENKVLAEREKEKELFIQEFKLNQKLSEAVSAQRHKISNDMHDELSSSLAALKYFIDDLKLQLADGQGRNMMADVGEEVRTIYLSARQYMHDLKLDALGNEQKLVSFLTDTAKRFNERGLLDITLDIDIPKIDLLLSDFQNTELYHVVREAFTNIIKHSEATEATVHISFEAKNCLFSISDNGKGFKENEAGKGIGLSSMHTRIQQLDGSLKIQSDENGTNVKGHFPIMHIN